MANSTMASWQGRPSTQGSAQQARRLRRLLLTLMFLASLAAFIAIVIWVLLPVPAIHIIGLAIADHDLPNAPPIHYAHEDVAAAVAVAADLPGGVSHHQLLPSTELQAVQQLDSVLKRLGSGKDKSLLKRDDVLVFYLTAHGVADRKSAGGGGYILCSDFNPQSNGGRLEVRELLQDIAQSPAALKLLVLDTGYLTADPRLGMIVNEFPFQLAQAVAGAKGDFWVLNSNALLERSHVSHTDRRSVFSYFVCQGLRGEADKAGDGNGWVELDELTKYVQQGVSRFVWHTAKGDNIQTPTLLQSGKGELPLGQIPAGIRIVRRLRDPAPSPAPPETPKAAQRFVPSSLSTLASITGDITQLAYVQNPGTAQSGEAAASDPTKTPTVTAPSAGTPAPVTSPAGAPTTPPTPAAGTTPPPVPSPAPAAPAVPATPATSPPAAASAPSTKAQRYAEVVAAVRKYLDEASVKRPDRRWTVIDAAPHWSRQLREHLLYHEQRVLLTLKDVDRAENKWLTEIESRQELIASAMDRDVKQFASGNAARSYAADDDLASAIQTRDEILQRLPELLRAYGQDSSAENYTQLAELIRNTIALVNEFSQAAASPDKTSVDLDWVQRTSVAAKRAQASLVAAEFVWRDEIDRLSSGRLAKGDAARIYDLLGTLLPESRQRHALGNALKLQTHPERLPTPVSGVTSPENDDRREFYKRQWAHAQKYARLLSNYAAIMQVPLSEPPPEMAQALQQLAPADDRAVFAPTALCQTYGELGLLVESTWRTPLTGINAALASTRFEDWRKAELLVRLTDARDVTEVAPFLNNLVGATWSSPIFGVPIADKGVADRIQVSGPESPLKLEVEPPTRVQWKLEAAAGLPDGLTVALDFDPQLISVRGELDELVTANIPQRVGKGKSKTLEYQVRALREIGGEATIKLQVRSTATQAAHIARFLLPKRTPLELLVNGTAIEFAPDAPGGADGCIKTLLRPFPSGDTKFALKLRNGDGRNRKIEYALFALPELQIGQVRRAGWWPWDDQYNPTTAPPKLLVKSELEVKADDTLDLPTFNPPPTAAAAPVAPAVPPAADKPPELEKANGGLLVMLKEGERRQAFWLDVQVRHPSTYIPEPFVNCDFATDRVTIELGPRINLAQLPPGGSRFDWENSPVAEQLTGQHRLASRLSVEASDVAAAKLFATMPRKTPVFLRVDGYPRSFIFLLSNNSLARVEAEIRNADRLAEVLQIASPAPGAMFKEADLKELNVSLQADLPLLKREKYGVRVGFPAIGETFTNSDRPLVFASDRLVTYELPRSETPGTLTIRTTVKDLTHSFAVDQFTNREVTLVAEIVQLEDRGPPSLAGRPQIVKFKIDGLAPTIEGPASLRVAQGDELNVQFRVLDPSQGTGVDKVELKFGEQKKLGERAITGDLYLAKFETKGFLANTTHQLEVQATDKVGNVSRLYGFPVLVTAPMAKPAAAATDGKSRLKVNVIAPAGNVSQMKIFLNGAPQAIEGRSHTFELNPGSYKLSATAIVNNKTYSATTVDVAVKPATDGLTEFSLELK